LHPLGLFHRYWDWVVVLLCIFSAIEVPVLLAFELEMDLFHGVGIASLAVDCLLMVDVVVTFCTAYFARFDPLHLVDDWTMIARRYLFGTMGVGWFLPDFIMAFPFELVLPDEAGIASECCKMLRMAKLVRVMAVVRGKSVDRHYLQTISFCSVCCGMLFTTHWAACSWYFVGYESLTDSRDSWLVEWTGAASKDEIDGLDPFDLYSASCYWAVITLFTTGYGDITATRGNLYESWLSMLVVLIGTCFVAYFIGTICSLILEGDRTQSVQLQKLEEAQAFCDQKRLSVDLSRAILMHIRYHCRYNFVFDEDDLISSLPPNLQHEVERQLGDSVLCQLDFFKSFTRSTGSLQTLGQIAFKMRSISCNAGFCIFRRGDKAKEIYFQRTGRSLMDFHDGSTKLMGRGDVFGENAIFSQKRKRTVVCSTFSEFWILPIREMAQLLMIEYPATFARRWKVMVRDLVASNERFGRHYVRSVQFANPEWFDEENEAEEAPPPQIDAEQALSVEAVAQNIRCVENEDADARRRPQNDRMSGHCQMVRRWPMMTHRNSVNRDDAIRRFAQKLSTTQSPDDFKTYSDAEGGDQELSLNSDEIGDIVPGLDWDYDSDAGAMGHRGVLSKAKSVRMGKGRIMGKFRRNRRRTDTVRKAAVRVMPPKPKRVTSVEMSKMEFAEEEMMEALDGVLNDLYPE